ncbi:MAG: tRNA1(Val) (adenine(37)-N6)-methyltransferase [Clostridiales bacterium]|nr:tRNA1(Val) (adenine(37)-N6)-methyltransferase [Clostridiales bacterium]
MIVNGVIVHENERLEDLQRNGLKLIQDPKRFCFGIDAVLLSSFASVKRHASVLDLCTGTGVIPILLSAKACIKRAVGIELEAECAEMAKRSVILNELEGKISIIQGDVKDAPALLSGEQFEAVTANPPYIKDGCGRQNDDFYMARAKHEISCSLEDVIKAASRLIKPSGSLYMVHRPDRLIDISCALRAFGFEPKRLRFVQSSASKPPMLILIDARRNGKPALQVCSPLIIYDDKNEYTPEARNIYFGS